MSESKVSAEEIVVHLVRPGVGARDYYLSKGATLADLLGVSGISTANQAVSVDGVTTEEGVFLDEGMVVTVTPRAAGAEPWRTAVPAFRDEAFFQEYSEVLTARRRETGPDEGRGG